MSQTPQKKPSDVRGVEIKCTAFCACPMCYGCRNFRSDSPDCQLCLPEKKKNICDTTRHKTKVVANMVTKSRIRIDNITFNSKQGDHNERQE